MRIVDLWVTSLNSDVNKKTGLSRPSKDWGGDDFFQKTPIFLPGKSTIFFRKNWRFFEFFQKGSTIFRKKTENFWTFSRSIDDFSEKFVNFLNFFLMVDNFQKNIANFLDFFGKWAIFKKISKIFKILRGGHHFLWS